VQPTGQEVFKVTRAQLVAGTVGAAVFLLTGIAALLGSGHYPGLLVWGALSLPLGIFEVSFLTGSTTTISSSGITRRRLLRRHCYRWADIAAIHVVAKTYRDLRRGAFDSLSRIAGSRSSARTSRTGKNG
jgi:hypothetical protein